MSSVLVTGGSRGIGAAIVERLLADGHRVAASYSRAPGVLDALDAVAIQIDLSAPGAAAQLYDAATEALGQLDGVINNAGVMPLVSPLEDQAAWDSAWADVMAVNVKAVADLAQLMIRDLGVAPADALRRIVTISSRAAYRGDTPDAMHYAASKGAVTSLMKSIARGYARQGLLAFTVAPGWVRTDMAKVAYQPGNEFMLDSIPLGRAAEPSEIAEMVAVLMSGKLDSATGTVIDINGASYVR